MVKLSREARGRTRQTCRQFVCYRDRPPSFFTPMKKSTHPATRHVACDLQTSGKRGASQHGGACATLVTMMILPSGRGHWLVKTLCAVTTNGPGVTYQADGSNLLCNWLATSADQGNRCPTREQSILLRKTAERPQVNVRAGMREILPHAQHGQE